MDETTTTDNPTPPQDNSGLLSALQKEREANKALRGQLKELKDSLEGIDIDALRKSQETAAKSAEREKERATALEKQLGDLKTELVNQTKMAAIRQAFFDAGGRRSDATDASFLDLVANAAMQRVAIADDGKLTVTKADGTPDFDTTSNQFKDLGGLMRELSQHSVYGVAFEPRSKASGSGLTGKGGSAVNVDDLLKMNPIELMQRARES